jgi:hypothetical protein
MQELKDMVFKNLQKDPIFYTKEGQFGVKGLGYSVDHPGLGEPKEPKGKYKSSGYGDLNEGMENKDPLERKVEDMNSLEREARIALSRIGYNDSVLSNYSRQDFIDTLKRESKDRFDNEKLADLVSKLESLKNESKISPEVYPNNTKINYKGEPVTIIGNFMNRNDESIQYTVEDKDGKTSEISSADKNITKITTESLEESKLRKVIREMINAELEEAYQLVNINPLKSDKEREERDPQQFLTTYIEPSVVDSLTKNQHLRILRNPSNPENVTLAIRATLAPISSKNLGKTTDNLDKLGIDIPTDFKSFLTDTNNLGGEKKLPTRIGEMVTYKILNNATLNKNGSLVIKVSNPKYNKPMESLQESIEKELAAINKEAEHEIIASKLEKVQALIDKKQAQISRLDEDEDMKDLTDSKKVKEISKDIKSLEKAKDKLEKMMHKGKAKSPRKEVIDETDEIIDETPIEDNNTQESLRESIEKELVAINKEAEHEIIASKLEKVQALIDKKQSQISRLDEDEDMKDLTDSKKVKEITKDIKSLERAKDKLEKMMHKGKAKPLRKEVIDETDETIDEVDLNEEPVSAVVTDKTKKIADEILKALADIDKLQFKNLEEDELKEINKETAVKIKEKAEQYYDEYDTLEDALREFKNEDEKEFARRHLKSAYGL